MAREARAVHPQAGARSVAERYRRFGEVDCAGVSPLYGRVATALSESPEALRVIEAAPARRRHPTVILAALHDLAIVGRAPALAAAFAANDPDAAASAAIGTLTRLPDAVAALAARHRARPDEPCHAAVLYPAIARAARLAGTDSIGLVDVGCGAGFDLAVDRVGVSYSNGQSLGDSVSPVQLVATIVGGRAVPADPVPDVRARIGIDGDPIDVTNADDARWLHASLWPDLPGRLAQVARLQAEIALAIAEPPVLLGGDPIELVDDAIAAIPEGALPMVLTTWALSQFPVARRRRFVSTLHDAAADRPLAWVSVEGVGVAPSIPTFGDRPASGHSIIGIAMFDRALPTGWRAQGVGRCWLRGGMVAWLADS